MKWYHYTNFDRLCDIIKDEALLSYYERLIQTARDEVPERVAAVKTSTKKLAETDPVEYHRNANVFLTATPDQRCGAYSFDIRLQFELDDLANFGCHLVLPRVSLEYLEEIVTVTGYSPLIKAILKREHNGKYAAIPVHVITELCD